MEDPVLLPRPLAFPVAGLDESVPLEALKSRVDLPDVERPDFARPRLEFALQPQAVLRLLAEQSKEGMRNAHGLLTSVFILSTILSMHCQHKLASWRSSATGAPVLNEPQKEEGPAEAGPNLFRRRRASRAQKRHVVILGG